MENHDFYYCKQCDYDTHLDCLPEHLKGLEDEDQESDEQDNEEFIREID